MAPSIPSVQLIGIGRVPAVAVSEVTAGETLMYNYGETSEVVAVEPRGTKSVLLITRDKTGELWTERKRATTLVVRVRHDGTLFTATG